MVRAQQGLQSEWYRAGCIRRVVNCLTRKRLLCTSQSIASPWLVSQTPVIPNPDFHSSLDHNAFQILATHFRLVHDLEEELWGKSWSLASKGPNKLNNNETPISSTTRTQEMEPCCDWGFTGRKGLGVFVDWEGCAMGWIYFKPFKSPLPITLWILLFGCRIIKMGPEHGG